MSIELIGLDNIPLVEPNDDICQIIKDAIEKQGCLLKHGDIILIAETLISKAEGTHSRKRRLCAFPSAVSQTALKAERGRCTVSFPYADRPMWLYSRSSDKHLKVLFQQMQNLLDEANRREYTVAGTSQDMGSGKSMARMGLKQMMRAVKGGLAQAVLVQNLTRLSHDPAILMKILEFLQDHNAVLITTESDLRYELYIKGLEKHFFRRAAQKGLRLPW